MDKIARSHVEMARQKMRGFIREAELHKGAPDYAMTFLEAVAILASQNAGIAVVADDSEMGHLCDRCEYQEGGQQFKQIAPNIWEIICAVSATEIHHITAKSPMTECKCFAENA